ncbi:hypothetical protein B9Q00_10695 [Candidatus Marsarchaeota G1 archaeon OSP_C]|uniref:Methyltransferase FkbM domain-containing protein n=1 Tax=Candidatus Marsarchaeota G1 archaeon OSP_C TaxID=1978154 RepID=A0A2R6AHT7_9ARCH|nr:MAG: hypothetical protein B9Q00_10695 [Candidatus Marsarchaeota G1 archaeon OSP_C]
MAETFLYDTHYTEGLEGSTVIQAGGFNGDTALYYAQRGAHVYSFEAEEQLYRLALENTALNPAIQPRITFENYALGKDGYTYLQRVERGPRAPAKRIRSLSLSTILREFRIASHTPPRRKGCGVRDSGRPSPRTLRKGAHRVLAIPTRQKRPGSRHLDTQASSPRIQGHQGLQAQPHEIPPREPRHTSRRKMKLARLQACTSKADAPHYLHGDPTPSLGMNPPNF